MYNLQCIIDGKKQLAVNESNRTFVISEKCTRLKKIFLTYYSRQPNF